MSDRLREMFYDPDQHLYDCDPYPSVLADLKATLAALEAGGGNLASWQTPEEAIEYARQYSTQYGLACYHQDSHGVPSQIA